MSSTRRASALAVLRLILGFPLVLLAGLLAGLVGALTTPPAGWRGDE